MLIKIKYAAGMEEIMQAHDGEWYDLRAAETVTMLSGDYRKISLGVAMQLPEGYEAIVAPRSSTFEKYGIIMVNGIGIIDNAFCGDEDVWSFPAYKLMGDPVTIKKNNRIAQFRILPQQEACGLLRVDHLNGPNRGGFGSTGVK